MMRSEYSDELSQDHSDREGSSMRTYTIEQPTPRSRITVRTYEDGVQIEWSSFVPSFDAEAYVRQCQAFDAVAHEWGC